MLKNIRLHLEKDEEKQKLLEESLAQEIIEAHSKNINSFDRNIPSLSALIKKPQLQNYSLFCNKFGEINIVDYGVGRTLYGFHPQQEISKQVNQFIAHAPYFSVATQKLAQSSSNEIATTMDDLELSEGYQNFQACGSAPEIIECLVVLGCGLGLHILELMQHKEIKTLVIYEPEVQYFQCSTLVSKWNEVFEISKRKGTKIFLQIGKDARNLLDDINELIEYENISGFYLFKHYNHPVFNSLMKDLTSKSWAELEEHGITFTFKEHYNEYLPAWTPSIDIQDYKACNKNSEKFSLNLDALKKFFPNIHEEYKNYKPKVWLPVQNSSGQINIVKANSLTPWYSDEPRQDCLLNYENYSEQPHKDGLVLGYQGTKLAHYIHYQFVKETEKLLAEAEEEAGILPENIESIIMFGLGVGYQLEELLNNHTVEKLFLCEPNTDFFYASLFAIDWNTIFETIDKAKGRVYLNIGDDGTHLFRDLLNQFHSIGPYILNNTYFYQSYYNASLNSAIAQLREQLQIVISMGEYFDHAYYGIEHTKEGMRRRYPLLLNNPSSKLSYDDKEVPVFIVGNGPSLDMSIEAIKEWREQAIIISCGTALQALHRNGIIPDFHAEIEQNRSTYDWAVLIGDLGYLKKITLISCNGIHPDTSELYKDVLVSFKEGESSTVSALSVLGQQNFEVLQHAFPTVSNFVTNLISVIGFNHIYLMGVDLGFVDVKYHHSRSSGYYLANGQETYDYEKGNNTSLIVPGNFRQTVNTKHEFKISKQILEQVTGKKHKEQTFYNCSDGAKIAGTTPLLMDNLLIVSSNRQKQHAIKLLKSLVFSTQFSSNFIERYEKKFSHSLLINEINIFEKLLEQDITTTEQASQLITKQKEMMFASYQQGQSLLFYYLYGTVNYTNAVLSKLVSKESGTKIVHNSCIQAKEKWLKTIQQIKQTLNNNKVENFDTSGYRVHDRVKKVLELKYLDEKLVIVTDSECFRSIVQYSVKEYFPWLKDVKILTPIESLTYKGKAEHLIYYVSNRNNLDKKIWIKGQNNTLVIITEIDESKGMEGGISFMYIPTLNRKTAVINELVTTIVALECCLSNHQNSLIIPKYYTSDDTSFPDTQLNLPLKNYCVYDYTKYLCIYPQDSIALDMLVPKSGARGKLIPEKLKMKHLVQRIITIENVEETQKKNSDIIENAIKNG